MTLTRLAIRNLFYHWRGNLAVLLGVWVGAAVLTGSLLVGDSLRGSLRQRTERQLAGIDHALIGPRFIREAATRDLPGTVKPAIFVQGTVRSLPKSGDPVALSKIAIYGVDVRFWEGWGVPASDDAEMWSQARNAVALSQALAEQLNVAVGDRLEVSTQAIAAIPRSSLLGRREADETTKTFRRLTVAAILPHDHPANAFSIAPSTSTPLNLFFPIGKLQKQLDQAGRINAIFASGSDTKTLNDALARNLTIEDWNIKVEVPKQRQSYVSIESRQLLLEPFMVQAAHQVTAAQSVRHADTFVYLANWISHGDAKIPYSLVGALDPQQAAPLGPFLPTGSTPLADDEIVLVDWKDSPIRAQPGETITLTFFEPEIEGKIVERSVNFRLKGIIPLTGAADDRDLTPEFPGITDKLRITEWDPPFPYDGKRIQKRDEDYWDRYRTTPKAYITLKRGQELWGSRFGSVTSIRLSDEKRTPTELLAAIVPALNQQLDPIAGGLTFDPVRERLLDASRGGTDFGMLFVAFSFFLIAAALMLVGLLFRLNIDRRSSELGVLRATGYPNTTVRRLLLVEGGMIAVLGSLLGVLIAVFYADQMLKIFTDLWPSRQAASILQLHVTPLSLIIGFTSTVMMAVGTIWFTARVLTRVAPRDLVAGSTSTPPDVNATAPRLRWTGPLIVMGIIGAIGLGFLAPIMPPGEARAGTFFGSGAMLLMSALALLWRWLKRTPSHTVSGHGRWAMAQLGSRNAGRNPTRSLLTAGLLASAAFLLVAVESFRRSPTDDFAKEDGGSGGFGIVGESELPLFLDLNSPAGRQDVLDGLQRAYQDMADDTPIDERLNRATKLLEGANIVAFRLQSGDDASCMNLYQAIRPRLLGVPRSLRERGGFRFSALLTPTDQPWELLDQTFDDGAIPVFVEQNTAMWMLKLGLGGDLEMPDESGRTMKLRIVGLMQDSVFQSEVLLADERFRSSFPHLEGYRYFLVQTPTEDAAAVTNLLTLGLRSHGFTAESTRAKLAMYLEVQNSYLTTFQLLGGFGLMLGVLGLAVVLLRGVWERRGELALLRALGYRTNDLQQLVLSENALLLVMGLGAGVLAALAAVLPHMASGVMVPWGRLSIMLTAVFLIGLIVTILAVWSGVRGSLIAALRRE